MDSNGGISSCIVQFDSGIHLVLRGRQTTSCIKDGGACMRHQVPISLFHTLKPFWTSLPQAEFDNPTPVRECHKTHINTAFNSPHRMR